MERNSTPGTISAAFLGTWTFPVKEMPGIGLIHFTDTGRAIQCVFNPQEPEKRIPMPLWYSVESPTQLRFRPKPDHAGWLRDYRFDGAALIIAAAEGRSWSCTRPSANDIPDWFPQALASFVTPP